jgi:hypothetical protein
MRWAVADFVPDQHHQCLVSLSDEFPREYDSFSMDIAIRVENKLELRSAEAFLVTGEGGSYRKMKVDLPENRNHTGILKLDKPKGTESLLLILRVGTESDDLDLSKTSASYYMLTLTKR